MSNIGMRRNGRRSTSLLRLDGLPEFYFIVIWVGKPAEVSVFHRVRLFIHPQAGASKFGEPNIHIIDDLVHHKKRIEIAHQSKISRSAISRLVPSTLIASPPARSMRPGR